LTKNLKFKTPPTEKHRQDVTPLKGKPSVACFLTIILLLVSIGLWYSEPAWAFSFQSAPDININSDGSIAPDLGLIRRSGNTYTMTGNIDGYRINIYCNGIVFDGAGYTLNTSAYYQAHGICLGPQTGNKDVTIKNVNILVDWSGSRSILLIGCSGCRITQVTSKNSIAIHGDNNVVTNCTAPISVFDGSGNVISRNNINDMYLGVNGGNQVYLNNIFASGLRFGSADNFLDNGSAGNYWIDYVTRYPNASEIDHTGIGDTPYIVDAINFDNNKLIGNNTDNYPLLYPYNIENGSITLQPPPTSKPSPARDDVSESSLTTYALAIAVSTTIAAVAVVLINYQRKRKT
jgi:hypothetical protein